MDPTRPRTYRRLGVRRDRFTRKAFERFDSMYRFDSSTKLALYARSGIPEYWIVNLNEQQIEVYSDPSGSAYNACRTYGADTSFAPLFAPSARLIAADVLP